MLILLVMLVSMLFLWVLIQCFARLSVNVVGDLRSEGLNPTLIFIVSMLFLWVLIRCLVHLMVNFMAIQYQRGLTQLLVIKVVMLFLWVLIQCFVRLSVNVLSDVSSYVISFGYHSVLRSSKC